MTELPFGFDKPKDSPGFLLWQTSTLWQRRIKKALTPHDISHAQFVIMALLLWLDAHGQETTQSAVISWSKLDKMTVSQSLKKLASLGLVERLEHEIDSRAKSVFLTESGRALIHQLVPLVESVDEVFFGTVSRADQLRLISLLGQLTAET